MSAAVAFAERDLLVLRRSVSEVLARSLVQPLLFVFVFTYVYPKMGATLALSDASSSGMATIILPGIVGFAALFCGLYAIGLPMAIDLGMDRDIDDRSLAPTPLTVIPVVRLISGAVQAAATAVIVLPMVAVIAVREPNTEGWHPAAALLVLLLVGAVTASIGLLIAGLVSYDKLPSVMTVVHLPLTFLGAGYYPWRALDHVPVLKWLLLLNPMTYVSEALRATLTPAVPHMPLAVSVPAMCVLAMAMAVVGARGITRQMRSTRA